MKKVYVASPLRGDIQGNIRRAKRLCHAAVLADVAPFAPHVLYTQFLDDTDPEEREMGLHCGEAWMFSADELWVFTKAGISGGMQEEIDLAKSMGLPIVLDPPAWSTIDG